jgi:hypothetical protein
MFKGRLEYLRFVAVDPADCGTPSVVISRVFETFEERLVYLRFWRVGPAECGTPSVAVSKA